MVIFYKRREKHVYHLIAETQVAEGCVVQGRTLYILKNLLKDLKKANGKLHTAAEALYGKSLTRLNLKMKSRS